jgi:hypothetical protein
MEGLRRAPIATGEAPAGAESPKPTATKPAAKRARKRS